MKKLLFLFLVMLLGCSNVVQPKGVQHHQVLIKHLKDSTVAIMNPEEGHELMPVMCTGVWIGQETFITARHCVDDMGSLVYYKTHSDFKAEQLDDFYSDSHTAVVKAIDKPNDLALVGSADVPPKHSFVPIAATEPYPGEPLNIIGHGGGLIYSYLPGVVSRIVKTTNAHDDMTRVIQTTAPIFFGDSGGGAFNEKGELVGICSFLMKIPSTGFLVHTDEIRALVKDNRNW